jgi:hypothetical protein
MSLTFDGDWSVPTMNGAPRLQHDIPERPQEATSIAVPMLSAFSVYSIPTTGTSTSFAGATWYILGDSGFFDQGGGVWAFTREWIRKPASFQNFETYAANYPGIRGENRSPFIAAGTSKIDVDFFLIAPSGGDYDSPAKIPMTEETRITFDGSSSSAPLLSGVFLSSGFFGFLDTTPAPTVYQGWITTDAATVTSYSIQAEPSTISQVRGPLWRRDKRFVKAK